MEENRKVIANQVGEFEKNVLYELKQATKLFNFKAYEQSFNKLEEAYKDLLAQVMRIDEDQKHQKIDMTTWKDGIIDQTKKIAVK